MARPYELDAMRVLAMRAANFLPASLRRPLAAVSLLGMATGIGAGMVFVTQTLLARQLGPAAYGLFASSLVTVTMVAPLAGFGLAQFRLKVYGSEGWGAHRWLLPSLRFTGITTLLAVGLVVGWALFGAPVNGTRVLLLMFSPVILSTLAVTLVLNKLRLEDRYRGMALWQLVTPGTRLLLVAALLVAAPAISYRMVAIGYCAIALLVAAVALPQMLALMRGDMALQGHGARMAESEATGDRPTLPQLWSQAWPYGVAAMLYPVLFQVGTVLLKYLSTDTQAGFYGIAVAVMAAIYLVPTTIYQKYLLAKLHRWAVHDKPKFWLVYRRAGAAMLLVGVVIGAALAMAAPWLVPLVFGEDYRHVATILLVLAGCVPLRFLSTAVGSVLLTEDHTRYRVYATALAVLVVIGLDVALIPRWQALGAAVATLAGEAVLLLATWYCVRRFVVAGR